GERRLRVRAIYRHFRRWPDDDRAYRQGEDDPRGAHRARADLRQGRRRPGAGGDRAARRFPLRLWRGARAGRRARGARYRLRPCPRRARGRHHLLHRTLMLTEINFDGLIGPSHNYAGLSPGNLAATAHAGDVSYPRAAALQGLAKMRGNMALGLAQGFFVPLPRPDRRWLDELAADATTDRALLAGAWSASSMWTANAATVSPAPDTADRRCHLTA